MFRGKIFRLPRPPGNSPLKGGTSLSKAHHLIERFSEDVDLTISRNAPHLVDGKSPMEGGISGKECGRRIETLREKAQFFVAANILPAFEADVEGALGKAMEWRVVLDENDRDRQTILFYYPRIDFGKGEAGYIKPHIKLEFGARGETEPSNTQTITPYIAEDFPQLFSEKSFAIPTLSAERSFWEKATILHALYHGAKMRNHMSRHYYDIYMMDQKNITATVLSNGGLLEQVVRNKILFFRDAKASYETAKIGSLRLVPQGELLKNLKRDYAAMNEMFMGKYPTFDEIVDSLANLEKQINTLN